MSILAERAYERREAHAAATESMHCTLIEQYEPRIEKDCREQIEMFCKGEIDRDTLTDFVSDATDGAIYAGSHQKLVANFAALVEGWDNLPEYYDLPTKIFELTGALVDWTKENLDEHIEGMAYE